MPHQGLLVCRVRTGVTVHSALNAPSVLRLMRYIYSILLLQKLLDSSDLNQWGAEAYPVINYILRSKNLDGVNAYGLPFCSGISSHELHTVGSLRIFLVLLVKSKNGLPLAHAFTLVARRKAGDFKKSHQTQNEEWNNSELLKMAWANLMISYPADSFQNVRGF
ncbi:hypothetical protein DFJ58DRAFT_795406 [Suillus subalutaceus]|uniref:uncharacterized protein n=1 Tax=Suillus subalutaceus TaxID=48586 RepID=UPI001B87BFA8|nr:uncharacterized protein DFJ58DRAFT_795406 [Suillus subalutaceus]KAG1849166.1 hypothetical protein DFJ58DRAFT_795406 [Suillus subalutaceus]